MGAGPKFGPFNVSRRACVIGSVIASKFSHSCAPYLQSDAPTAQRDTVILFSSVYIALRKDVPQPRNGDVLGWLADMLSWTVSAQNALQTDAGLAILSAVANKHLPASLPDDAHKLLENFWRSEIEHAGNADNGGLSDGSGGEATAAVPAEGTVARRVRAVQAWFWIAKALIVRAAPEGEKMVDAAREKLFDDPVIGRHTARALTLVAKADDGILNKENGATLRVSTKRPEELLSKCTGTNRWCRTSRPAPSPPTFLLVHPSPADRRVPQLLIALKSDDLPDRARCAPTQRPAFHDRRATGPTLPTTTPGARLAGPVRPHG